MAGTLKAGCGSVRRANHAEDRRLLARNEFLALFLPRHKTGFAPESISPQASRHPHHKTDRAQRTVGWGCQLLWHSNISTTMTRYIKTDRSELANGMMLLKEKAAK